MRENRRWIEPSKSLKPRLDKKYRRSQVLQNSTTPIRIDQTVCWPKIVGNRMYPIWWTTHLVNLHGWGWQHVDRKQVLVNPQLSETYQKLTNQHRVSGANVTSTTRCTQSCWWGWTQKYIVDIFCFYPRSFSNKQTLFTTNWCEKSISHAGNRTHNIKFTSHLPWQPQQTTCPHTRHRCLYARDILLPLRTTNI